MDEESLILFLQIGIGDVFLCLLSFLCMEVSAWAMTKIGAQFGCLMVIPFVISTLFFAVSLVLGGIYSVVAVVAVRSFALAIVAALMLEFALTLSQVRRIIVLA